MTWREIALYSISAIGFFGGFVLIFFGMRSTEKYPGFSLTQFAFKTKRPKDSSGYQMIGEGVCGIVFAAILFCIVYFRVFAK